MKDERHAAFADAEWIAAPWVGAPRSSPPVPCLRREFDVGGDIASATLAITAYGLYEATLNGRAVGDEVLSPGWTDYRKRVLYQVHDVTGMLDRGRNVLGVLLGDGWYCGHISWLDRQLYGERPWLLARLVVLLRDGTSVDVRTDADWRVWFSAIAESDLLQGEVHDARNHPSGWDKPHFDDSHWLPALTGNPHPGSLVTRRTTPPVRRGGELEPVKIDSYPDARGHGRKIVDFGRNIAGRVRVSIKAKRGTSLKFRFAEVLDGDGKLYTENLRSARASDNYTTGSDKWETWEPKFTFHGFRYMEVLGLAPTDEFSVQAILLHSDMAVTGRFLCSNPLLDELQANILQGQKGNFLDIPTDCPQRDERLGWTGDAQVFVATAAFNMDVQGFFHKWLRDMRDAQSPGGAVPPVIPTPGPRLLSMEDGGPAWSDACIVCPWIIYVAYGDRRVLEENYHLMDRYMEYLRSRRSRDFIRSHPEVDAWGGFGDWLALDGSETREGATPKDLIGTAFFAHDAGIMARVAEILGRRADAEAYAGLRDDIVRAFRRRFLTEDGLLAAQTQTAHSLALRFELVGGELRADLAEKLVDLVKENNFRIGTGFVGTPHILHALSDNGQLDTAYRLLEQEGFPSWLFPVRNGATTIWERWDGWTPEKGFADKAMNSFNHYAYGAVGEWMYTRVAGLNPDPDDPGYRHIIFRPSPGGSLTWAEASLQTAFGPTRIRWELAGEQLHLELSIPPGTRGSLFPPSANSEPELLAPGNHTRTLNLHTQKAPVLAPRALPAC